MEFLKFDAQKCVLCGQCVQSCPFGALSIGKDSIEVNENCRMCGLCVRHCPEQAIRFEQRANEIDKSQ